MIDGRMVHRAGDRRHECEPPIWNGRRGDVWECACGRRYKWIEPVELWRFTWPTLLGMRHHWPEHRRAR